MGLLSERLFQSLLKQLEKEFTTSSSYFYCSNWLAYKNYPGFSSYFMKESIAEQEHGREINLYLLKRGHLPNVFPLKDIHPLELPNNSPLDIFKHYNLRENENLISLNELSGLAHEEKDFATVEFLNKFLLEQVDSCAEAQSVYEKANLYDKMPLLFYHLDHELGKKK